MRANSTRSPSRLTLSTHPVLASPMNLASGEMSKDSRYLAFSRHPEHCPLLQALPKSLLPSGSSKSSVSIFNPPIHPQPCGKQLVSGFLNRNSLRFCLGRSHRFWPRCRAKTTTEFGIAFRGHSVDLRHRFAHQGAILLAPQDVVWRTALRHELPRTPEQWVVGRIADVVGQHRIIVPRAVAVAIRCTKRLNQRLEFGFDFAG